MFLPRDVTTQYTACQIVSQLIHIDMEDRMGLRKIRRQRGLTIEQIAMLAGVDQSTISRAERGLQRLRPESVVKISKALKVPPRKIVEEEL
jgi:predicted transcriptional regulator